jgi:hypothetical protein
MAPARSLTAHYEAFLLTPRSGAGVCPTCFNLIHERCFGCSRNPSALAAVLPISYSVGHEQLHRALAGYKRIDGTAARLLGIELSAVTWRFLERHERCLAEIAGTDGFELVTTVPSGDLARDRHHPLRWVVGELIGPVRDRHEHLLHRSPLQLAARQFNPAKYVASRRLQGEAVLLLDDTWTTGASAQSAAAALLDAGAGAVAAVVIGRHINREWRDNDGRLRALPRFDWDKCAVCWGKETHRVAATEATAL